MEGVVVAEKDGVTGVDAEALAYNAVSCTFLKARPAVEGDKRFVYMEPSNERRDSEGEVVLKKALQDSVDYFLQFGNIDIDHLTLVGFKLGMENPREWEIGKPVDVKFNPFVVKAELYQGEAAKKANWVWETMTGQTPPMPWFPSVAGRFPVREQDGRGAKVVKVMWNNIGISREPINHAVKPVSLTPDEFMKAVTAGYGTNSAGLMGGGALRRQSLQGAPQKPYNLVASRYLKAIVGGVAGCDHVRHPATPEKISAHFEECEQVEKGCAKAYTDRLIKEIATRWQPAKAAA